MLAHSFGFVRSTARRLTQIKQTLKNILDYDNATHAFDYYTLHNDAFNPLKGFKILTFKKN